MVDDHHSESGKQSADHDQPISPTDGFASSDAENDAIIGDAPGSERRNRLDGDIDRAVGRSLRWPETIMAVFTIVIAGATIWNANYVGDQLGEMKRGGVDTHTLASATGNLVTAYRDEVTDTHNLAGATGNLVTAYNAQETNTKNLATAAARQAVATKSLAATSKDQLATLAKQQTAMEGQLAQMSEQNRPWVTIRPSFPDGIKFYPSFMMLAVYSTVENVGRSPAFHVQVTSAPYIPSAANPDAEAAEKQRCDTLKDKAAPASGWGVMLFPGDRNDNPEGDHLRFSAGGSIDQLRRDARAEGIADGGFLMNIVGCVDYVYGNPAQHHQTGYYVVLAHLIHRPGMGDAESYEFKIGEDVPGADIIIEHRQQSNINTY